MILMGQVNAAKLPDLRNESPDDNVVNNLDIIASKIPGSVTQKANLEHPTDPISTGVHLYKDVTTSSKDGTTKSPQSRGHADPLLFGDFERFVGGTTLNDTDAGRSESKLIV